MKTRRKVWLLVFLLGVGGLGLFLELLIRHGVRDIVVAVETAGWGIAAVVAFHALPVFLDGLSWRALVPSRGRPNLWTFCWAEWVGDSVGTILPVVRVGGEIVRIRLAAVRGLGVPLATASVLVVITVSIATQIVFTLSGLSLLGLIKGGTNLTRETLVGAATAVAAVGGFYAVQRFGLIRLLLALAARIGRGEEWRWLGATGEAIDHELSAAYERRRGLAASCLWASCTWVAGACEMWLTLWAVGERTPFWKAYVLESMTQGVRTAAFFVPGVLGVQEGAFVVVGGIVGIAAPTALAMALIRRVRELAFGVPGVMAWQWIEGWGVWMNRPPKQPAPSAHHQGS